MRRCTHVHARTDVCMCASTYGCASTYVKPRVMWIPVYTRVLCSQHIYACVHRACSRACVCTHTHGCAVCALCCSTKPLSSVVIPDVISHCGWGPERQDHGPGAGGGSAVWGLPHAPEALAPSWNWLAVSGDRSQRGHHSPPHMRRQCSHGQQDAQPTLTCPHRCPGQGSR